MESRVFEKVKTVWFLALAVLMYYFLNEYIDFGLVVTYRHAFSLALFVSAVLLFLVNPNIARGFTAFRDACVYSTPLAVTTVVSLFIWFTGLVDLSVITRGLSSSFIYMNMLSMALGAGALLYVFGQKGIWYNLFAILIANVLMILTVIAQNGLAAYMKEFVTLITTFAGETGEIIVQAEVHELAFCLGAYLVYMLYKPQKKLLFFVFLALSLFCFLSAFKRIAIVAIALALAFGYLLKLIAKFRSKTAVRVIFFLELVLIAVLLLYVALIKMDAFALLEKVGIETSGRVGVYRAVDSFYEFSPSFLGNGIGYLTYRLNTNLQIGVASIHNDFLQHFIDLGFWGYILWLVSMTLVRTWYFGRKGETDNAIVTFILTIYLIVVSSTDNTMNYPLLMGVLAMLMMGNTFGMHVRRTEYRIFGSVSKENEEEESETLL